MSSSNAEIIELDPGDPRLDEIYPVLRELRDELSSDAFHERYEEGHRDGYRIAALYDEDECCAVAGYRVLTNFIHGRVLYVDDLVTSSVHRSKGYGAALETYLTEVAERHGCERVTLDSGVGRAGAHKFYFRQGYVITSYHFGKSVDRDGPART